MNLNRIKEKSINEPFVSIFATLIILAILGLTLKLLPFNNEAMAAAEDKAQEQFPRERTLYATPTATIYLDGLMVFCHDGSTFQAGIHTATEPEHGVTILVRKRGKKDPVLYKQFTHQQIRNMRPLSLYVEGANGKPLDPSAELYEKNNASLRQAFANVLNFQSAEFHGPGLKLVPGVLVPINILQGEFYSATLGKVGKKKAGTRDLPTPLGKRSSMVAADISQDSGAIVMTYGDRKKEIFRLPLNSSTQYEINILNEPPEERHHSEAQHHSQPKDCKLQDCDCPNDPNKNHFPEYYKAFDLKTFSDKLILCMDDDDQQETRPNFTFPAAPPVSTAMNKLAPGATTPFATLWRPPSPGRRISLALPEDPPCVITWVSNIPRLPDWP